MHAILPVNLKTLAGKARSGERAQKIGGTLEARFSSSWIAMHMAISDPESPYFLSKELGGLDFRVPFLIFLYFRPVPSFLTSFRYLDF